MLEEESGIVSYIDEYNKLYHKGLEAKNNKNGKEEKEYADKLKGLIKQTGSNKATYKDIEEAFNYGISLMLGEVARYHKNEDAKIEELLRVVKQVPVKVNGKNVYPISDNLYKEVLDSFRLIDQDYKIMPTVFKEKEDN